MFRETHIALACHRRAQKAHTTAMAVALALDATKTKKKGPRGTGKAGNSTNRHGPTENDNEYRQNLYKIMLLGMIQVGIDPTACAS